jgi:Ras-related GTP-binding protein C/D
MSEIYGQPINNNVQNIDSDDVIIDDESTEWNSGVENDENNEPIMNGNHSLLIETTDQPASSVFDSMSSSVIKLTGGRALYLKEINRHLALICVLREEALTKQAIIDYNVKQLKESILKLFRLNHQT